MTALPTNEEVSNKQERQQKLEELKKSAQDWLSYNRKILNAQADFLTAINKRRSPSSPEDNMEPLLIKNIRIFLSS